MFDGACMTLPPCIASHFSLIPTTDVLYIPADGGSTVVKVDNIFRSYHGECNDFMAITSGR